MSGVLLLPAAVSETCGSGYGMAACPLLGLLVTSSYLSNVLTVFALRAAGTMTVLRTIGGSGSGNGADGPLNFDFLDSEWRPSGWMAFTGGTAETRLLLVTDAGNDAVHVIDVVQGKHAGYVASPGAVARPRGVAVRGTKAAVSAYTEDRRVCEVRVYEGSGSSWTVVRVFAMDRVFCSVFGVRFTGDGTGLAVAGQRVYDRGWVSMLFVHDGSVQTLATGMIGAVDVEECGEYGWIVADCSSRTVEFLGGRARLERGSRCPTALAYVPGFGLAVREEHEDLRCSTVQLFATRDAIAMAAMSVMKTAWMATVARAISVK